jgi:hypothetical protein
MSLAFNDEIEWHIFYPCFIVFLSREGWSSYHVQANKNDIFEYLRDSNHYHSTKKFPLYKVVPPLLSVYIPLTKWKPSTSCPKAQIEKQGILCKRS